eukprot:3170695-Amphidinium_carterae.1
MTGILGHISTLIGAGEQAWMDWLEEHLTEHPDDIQPLLKSLITRTEDLEVHFRMSPDFTANPYATTSQAAPVPGIANLPSLNTLRCRNPNPPPLTEM